MLHARSAVLLLLLAGAHATAHAELRPIGPEFAVVEGRYDLVGGYEIDVAGDEFGNFVVVWGRSDLYQLYGVRLSASNVAGAPFDLGGDPAGYDFYPRIAMQPSGEFVVTWSASPTFSEDDLHPVARRFDRSGVPQGDVFAVVDPSGPSLSDVAMDATGAFVVVWDEFSDQQGILARRFDPSGLALGGAFQVNAADEAGNQRDPAVAADGTGGFVVAWSEFPGDGDDDSRIAVRRFDATATPMGPASVVNEVTGSLHDPVVGADAAGNFVVTWVSHYDENIYGSAVAARRFDAAGAPVTGERRVARRIWHQRTRTPRIAVDPSGEFVVVWGSLYDENAVFARTSAGRALGPTIKVSGTNDSASNVVILPAVGTGGSGDFLVVWADEYRGLMARRFGPPRTTTNLRLKDNTDPSRRKLTIKPAGAVTSSRLGTRIDPPRDGAFLQVYNASGAGTDSACIPLPAAHWTAKGSEAGAATRFAYRDPDFADGPCASVTVVDRKVVKAACQGKLHPLEFSLDEAQQGSVAVRLVTGEHAYCSVFGSDAPVDEPGRFAAANATPAGECPPAPASCP